MKEKLVQIMILSGFYYIISFLLGQFDNIFINIIDDVSFMVWIVWTTVLWFIKPRYFLKVFKEKYPRISIYLVSIGWIFYFSIPFYMLSAIDGYQAAMAKYHGIGYASFFEGMGNYIIITYVLLFAISLTVATVMVVRKSFKK